VVGADGVESKVGRWAGINTTLKPGDIEVCAQHLVHDNGINDDYCEFYLGNKIAPGGYVWEFPKGKKLANVGLGVLGSRSEPGLPMRCLKEFLRIRMPEAKVLEIMVGGVPVSGPIETAIADGVMLVGDAARQSDPLTGGGIVNGMRAGVMAGEVAADAISRGDTSRSGLLAYEEMWRETIGKHISRNYNLKEFFVNLTDEDLNGLVRSLKDVDTSNMDLKGVVRLASKLNPHLLWKMRKLV
jgi:digeranylgeranylglycerophospholipid reductase